MKVKVYLTDEEWAYPGVYQKIGNLPACQTQNEKLWVMLGALLTELSNSNIKSVEVYNDTRLVEEWNEQVKFDFLTSQKVAAKIKNTLLNKFIKLEVKKLDRHSIESQMKLI